VARRTPHFRRPVPPFMQFLHTKRERAGLLTSAMIKGAVVTLGGVTLWWFMLVLVDYLRLGRLY